MKQEDVKVGMEFSMNDISSYWVIVEGIDGDYALCRYLTCFSHGREKVRLSRFVKENIFKRIK